MLSEKAFSCEYVGGFGRCTITLRTMNYIIYAIYYLSLFPSRKMSLIFLKYFYFKVETFIQSGNIKRCFVITKKN